VAGVSRYDSGLLILCYRPAGTRPGSWTSMSSTRVLPGACTPMLVCWGRELAAAIVAGLHW